MPRYYFDFREDGVISADDEGYELPDIKAARREAASSLAEMARDRVRNGAATHNAHRMSIEVRSESGPSLQAKFTLEV
jgi:hypothetical protein